MRFAVLCVPALVSGRWISERGLYGSDNGIDNDNWLLVVDCCESRGDHSIVGDGKALPSFVCEVNKNSPKSKSGFSKSRSSRLAISESGMASVLSRTKSPSFIGVVSKWWSTSGDFVPFDAVFFWWASHLASLDWVLPGYWHSTPLATHLEQSGRLISQRAFAFAQAIQDLERIARAPVFRDRQ